MRRSVFRRLIRSLPTRRGVMGVATCDKGLPAMMMALAAAPDLPACWFRAASRCWRKKARTRARCNRWGRGLRMGRSPWKRRRKAVPRLRLAGRRLPVPGHRGHVAGGGRSVGNVAAAFGAGAFGPAALAGYGAAFGAGAASLEDAGLTMRRHPDAASVRNAMVVHAAFGGSTNLILHIPAIAHAAGLRAALGRGLDADEPARRPGW